MNSKTTRISVFKKAVSLCVGFMLVSLAASAQIAMTGPAQLSSKQPLISVNFVQTPLPEALNTIARKVDVGLSYKTKSVPSKPITYHAKDVPVYNALDAVLKNTDLYYTLSENQKVILIKQNQLHLQTVKQPDPTVSGTVTDARTGDPLIGVNILVVGTTIGTVTNTDGHYSLNVSSLQDTLRFSYIGYKTKTVPIDGRTTINVTLKSSVTNLNQMVVIGFGTQKKRNVVASISSVDMKSLNKVHSTTFTQKLEGRIPGVKVNRTSGRLGAPVRINIRGVTSINASSSPLYVVDGVPIVNKAIGSGGGVFGVNGAVTSFLNISAGNIKSIRVLKGAAASAIYGSRGSNGVVLITTKSGQAGHQVLNINVSGGFTHPTNTLNLLNPKQYMKVYNYRQGTHYSASDYASTNWQDVITRVGSFQKYNVSLSGGTEQTTYFVSSNYKNSKGFILSNSIKSFGSIVKVHHKFNDRLNITAKLNPSITNLDALRAFGQVGAPFGFAVLEPPLVPVFLPDGSVYNGRNPSVPGTLFSPFPGTPYSNLADVTISNSTKQALASIKFSYDILSNLTFKSSFGYQFLVNKVYYRAKTASVIGYPNGVVSVSHHSFTNADWRNTLTYQKDWDNNSLKVTIGTTFQKSKARNSALTKNNIPLNGLNNLSAAAAIAGGSGTRTSYTFQNNIARISYNYKGTYLVTLTGSYNGTSRFAKGHRYGFFPAVAAGWIISDEDFISSFDALNFLKLRVGYGATGNANIGNFTYSPLFRAGASYAATPGLQFSQLANYDLTWETSIGLNIGLDYGFFNNRLSGTINYFNKTTKDLLLARRVSNVNGFTSILKNGGKIKNTGFEFKVSADIIRSNNFLWSVRANITTVHNEVKKLPGGAIIGTNLVKVGKPIGVFYMPVYKGVDNQTGDALYADGKGGVTSNYALAPRQIVGNPHPNFYGGFGTNLSFKGFKLNAFFNYTYGNKLYWRGAEYLIGGSSIYNQLAIVRHFWTPNNKDAPIPEPRLEPNGASTSTRFLYDGSYLRLTTLQLSYTFSVVDLIGAESIRIYIGGSNLLTIENFPGIDPEATVSSTSNITLGIVDGNDPLPVKLYGGIQFKF